MHTSTAQGRLDRNGLGGSLVGKSLLGKSGRHLGGRASSIPVPWVLEPRVPPNLKFHFSGKSILTLARLLDFPENIHSPNIAGIIIDKIAESQTVSLSENLVPDTELAAYQWRRLQQGGHWNGKILVQLTTSAELVWLYKRAHGSGICSVGHRATLEISSPSRVSLAAELFS